MTITTFDPAFKNQFADLLCNYFSELDAQIPDHIIRGKLLDLILRLTQQQIIQTDLMTDGGTVVGFAIYQIDTPQSDWCKRPGWGFIREFYICPSFRRQGFGCHLSDHCYNALADLGATRFYLTSDSAIEFWEKCGWKKTTDICSNDLLIMEK